MGDDDRASDQLLAAGHPLAEDRPVVGQELEVEGGHPDAGVAVADRRLADVAQPPAEGEVGALDGVHQRRAVDGLGDDVGERGVAFELGQPEGRPEAADDRVDEVGEDVLRVIELDPGEIAGVAGDVGDDETGGFGRAG